MIKKIEISNVGRFKSSRTDGDEQYFKESTFIYGKNTYGKSTLTAIFRSLKENKPDIIIGRKTINAQTQIIKIIPNITTPVSEYRYTTTENRWNEKYEDIIIFDNHFVRENVYTQNQQIGRGQQKNIEAFMLGSNGAEYNRKISNLEERIRINTNKESSISSEYTGVRSLLGNLSFNDFLVLTEIPDINQKIKEQQAELDKIKNAELISHKLKEIKNVLEKYKNFNTSEIKEKLSVNIETITDFYNANIDKKDPQSTYEEFLQIGSKLAVLPDSKQCPFCTQEITDESAKQFVATINSIYNEKYRNLQKYLTLASGIFSFAKFSTDIEKNIQDIGRAGHTLDADFSSFEVYLKECEAFINKKIKDLSIEFDNSCFDNINIESKNLISYIEKNLADFDNPTGKKIDIEESMKKMAAHKERHSAWKQRCKDYSSAKNENTTLSSQKAAVWTEYLEYAGKLSSSMLVDINTILGACGCNFTVQQFNFQGNQRQELFVLNLGDYPISNDGEDREVTIKNCLSDSDKWILALSLFLATVKNDNSAKVVILDDPVSSFDSDRRLVVLREIKRIVSGAGKQLILMTHEKGSYQILYKEYAGSPSSVFLKIKNDIVSGSDFVVCNPNEDVEFMNDYNCWITEMKNALLSQEISVVRGANDIPRKVFEHILKLKYPIELVGISTLGNMLEKLEEAGNQYEINSPRSAVEAILPNLNHHDNSRNGDYPSDQLGIEDYRTNIKKTFDVMKIL